MRIFTKMKHALLVVAAMCCVNTAFAQEEEYKAVWVQDFEDATTFSDGFKSGSSGRFSVTYSEKGYKEGSHALSFSPVGNGNNGTTNTFSPTTELANAFSTYKDEYLFDFYYYQQAGNNQSGSGLNITFTGGKVVNILAPVSSAAEVNVSGGETLGTVPNKTWCHIYIYTKDTKTKFKITSVDGATEYVAETVITETSDYISKISNPTKRYYGEFRFDDMTLSAPGAKEEISVPSISITKVNGINRVITVEPGVGTVGTAASATYYTTDGTDPSKENGNVYSAPFEISTTSTIKAISYLPDGTASEITTFEAEAGAEISLSEEIINVVGFAENGDVLNPIIGDVYNKNSVFLSPEVNLAVTFNGTPVALPYTVTEDGTIVVTATAEGYVSTSKEYVVNAAYKKIRYVDFTTTTTENLAEFENGRWSIKDTNTRWANWDKSSGDIYNTASLSDDADGLMAGDFLYRATSGTLLLVGYGVGRNVNSGTKTEFRIANPSDGQIVLYEMNESLKLNTTSWKPYYVMFVDDDKMSCQADGTQVLAKVSLYSPVRDLVVTDGEDFDPEYDYYTSATYTRSIEASKYGTICLPFAPDAASLEAYNFYELTASTVSGTDGEVTFTKVDAPEANKPYIYCLADKDATEAPAITGGATKVSTEAGTTIISGWQMVGSFTNQTVDCTDKAIYALNGTTQKLMKVTQSLSVPAYRAYIEGTSSQLNLQALTVRISGPTGIEQISAADVEGLLPATIYDLMGRPVQNPQKGHLYIQGGKKVVY